LQAGGQRFKSAHLHHNVSWAYSSVGESARLISVRSVVRLHLSPPKCTLKTAQRVTKRVGQVIKSTRWMPRSREATKGAVSGETLRVAASRHRSGGTRMGEPTLDSTKESLTEFIGQGSEPGELKHLSSPRNRKKTRCPK
jgi:hypothetical protein